MLDSSRVVYVAHPYSGSSENYENISRIVYTLCKVYSDKTFISPIHSYGFMYNDVDYDSGLRLCFKLMDLCDTILLCGDWINSKGCVLEKEYAELHNKKVEVL